MENPELYPITTDRTNVVFRKLIKADRLGCKNIKIVLIVFDFLTKAFTGVGGSNQFMPRRCHQFMNDPTLLVMKSCRSDENRFRLVEF